MLKFGRAVWVLLWGVVIVLPLAGVAGTMIRPVEGIDTLRMIVLMGRTFGLAGVIGVIAVLLGFLPGRLLGSGGKGKFAILMFVLIPLVLPRYVLYYSWTLLFNPATELGRMLASRGEVGRFVWTLISTGVLVSWYWPLAALIIGQGYRNLDRAIFDSAALEAGAFDVFRKVTLPLLKGPLVLAFGVCFVMSLSEFTTFHLAGVETIGTELAVLYEMTGMERYPAVIAAPVFVVALVVAICLERYSVSWGDEVVIDGSGGWKRRDVVVLVLLAAVSFGGPVVVLLGNVADLSAFRQFVRLHLDELLYSVAIAGVAAVLAHLIALAPTVGNRIFKAIVQGSIFVAMFLPASLVGVSILKLMAFCKVPYSITQSWFVVSFGHAVRLAGAALIFQLLTRSSQRRQLGEMARLDGATAFEVFWRVYWPVTWMPFVSCFLLMVMFSITELSATMVLLPAGVPNFAQRLLNQMHYARDQQVIASCLVLIGLFVVLASVVVGLLRFMSLRRLVPLVLLPVMIVGLAGCDGSSEDAQKPKVLDIFGSSGRGDGEFLYPRAIDISGEGVVAVVDKTGRVQRFNDKGEFISKLNVPEIEAGKPTGISFGPNGDIYVADTHYHRVLAFDSEGSIVSEFGEFGKGDGCFVYPTDVAFVGEGEDLRIFVSEYGGNDRVSVFDGGGEFLRSFSSWGSGEGEVSRPSAICVDDDREVMYVADACNHRIAVYDYEGGLIKYIGSVGRGRGELRYPYDLALMPNGDLIVCEFGNNRLQLFDADGESLGIYGGAGREPGQLAYPWGVAVDGRGRVFVVDAGNNRIQVWRL